MPQGPMGDGTNLVTEGNKSPIRRREGEVAERKRNNIHGKETRKLQRKRNATKGGNEICPRYKEHGYLFFVKETFSSRIPFLLG